MAKVIKPGYLFNCYTNKQRAYFNRPYVQHKHWNIYVLLVCISEPFSSGTEKIWYDIVLICCQYLWK
ncbi:hypothetical protein GJ496_008625 [Pomphorhynchus laevis]|nr:hypothetical protein GJ496_008625 [Pomphorhynchus laevis]